MGKVVKQRVMAGLLFYVSEFIITSILMVWLFQVSQAVGNIEVHIKGLLASFLTLGILAYLFGLRHAVDADHLAAIDNSTRKLVQEGKSSLFTGLFFSLGHSTVVILLSVALMLATRAIESSIPQLENVGSIIGTLVSGFFLYIIGFLNFIVLIEIYKLFKEAKEGKMNEDKLNDTLLKRGFMNRFFKNLFKIVNSQYYLYPIGFLFGLGFDTASETALLAISAGTAGAFTRIPLWTLLVFPLLFTAGMTLIDTTDGLFMNGAYRWAFMGHPIKKVWYNLTMTVISVLVAYVVGSLELLGLVQSEFNLNGGLWDAIALINGGVWWGNIGIIIIATFAIVWVSSIIIYKTKIRKYEI
ncbi:HoxN/HupN/NixA family nickel/cobalt transporter [Metallosphaera tengchongensis]|uniref:Nickel/cobalt efflux system n=1 Tax=Metallosphaera tengchongensis TaxID=1532350 RepID=A0A6N0P0J9_9CREN|nr:HoxN/HupN/NixA family nickel/cobalt transporter [Metallosphaera tengchongensis]QKR00800.1 HoxN/HupN/NixA family nickel/cobalt transporter [Metallosphaera tengchongensis]